MKFMDIFIFLVDIIDAKWFIERSIELMKFMDIEHLRKEFCLF
jgi:hypothetical protein